MVGMCGWSGQRPRFLRRSLVGGVPVDRRRDGRRDRARSPECTAPRLPRSYGAVSKGFWPLKTAETAGPRRHGSGESTGALPFQGVIGNNRAYGVAWERAVAGTAARAVPASAVNIHGSG